MNDARSPWFHTICTTFSTHVFETQSNIVPRKPDEFCSGYKAIMIITKLTCKFGGQWSKSSNICLMFCASCMIKFNSMSNSPPTNCNRIKSYSRLVLNTLYSKLARIPGFALDFYFCSHFPPFTIYVMNNNIKILFIYFTN